MKRFFSLISVFLLIFAVAACGGKKKSDENLRMKSRLRRKFQLKRAER